jgi:hypothetical protein
MAVLPTTGAAGDEDVLEARPVRRVPHLLQDEAGTRERHLDLRAAAEPQRRI